MVVKRSRALRWRLLQSVQPLRDKRCLGPAAHATLRIMRITETGAGTQIVERSPEEYAAYLEREVQSAVGMSVEEFTRAYTAGELEDGDVAVDEMVGLLRIGQNGNKAVA
jgi:hypothetical protein